MTTSRPRRLLRQVLASAAVVVALGAVGCGESDDSTPASSARKGIRIEFAFAGVPGDPYYTVIKNGASQAEKDMGVTVEYKETAQYDFQEQVRLIKAAIARKPDGLVVSEESPEVLDGPVKEAVAAGIPVIIAAAGEDSVEKTGALGFVGQNEFEVGVKAGEQLHNAGVERVACLNPAVGTPNLDARCNGLKKVLGDDVVAIDQTDRTSAKNRVKAILQRGEVDGLLALAAATVAEPALAAVEELD